MAAIGSKTTIRVLAALAALACVIAGGLWYALEPAAPPAIEARVSSSDLLYAPPGAGFKRVTEPQEFVFPADHGPHPEYQTEWWYYTGNLTSADGRSFGYQLTFFRQGLTSEPVSRTSEWGTNSVYNAHFTLTDGANQQFYAFNQTSRGATGLAGATATPFAVFVENWAAQGPTSMLILSAQREGISLQLELKQIKPPTLQGDHGVSHRSIESNVSSYYYSLTRMETNGTIKIGNISFVLTGNSWFDHEWSTGILGRDQIGWDWFGLHLEDGRDLALGQIRGIDEAIKIASGTITSKNITGDISKNTPTIILEQDDFEITVLDTWASPHTGTVYPASWRIQVPKANIDLKIKPLVLDQELRFPPVTYWEGAVTITGTTTGRGYIELTGYNFHASNRGAR